ncbi:MAG: thioesterase family protein [Alphaproteobacteria bacterium]|nr:thioesterase family protein [Alphaproteobacteria bacterium]
MNLAYYVVIFDHATDVLFDRLGIGEAYTANTGNSIFVLETHTLYERELTAGERVRVHSYVVAADAKRLHFAHEMFADAAAGRAAMQELVALHVDMRARRGAPFPADRQAAIAAAVAQPPLPSGLGRGLGLTRT